MRHLSAILICLLMLSPVGRAAESRHIVLVHGIHDSGAGMHSMADYLSGKGFAVHAFTYTPSDGSVGLDSLAEQLASFVDRDLPRVRKFDVVAFSMGGLVARCYIQKLGGAVRTGRFITISSPNRGTLLAYLLWNAAGKQMRPDSDFLNALNSDLSCYHDIQWATVRTPFDLTIIPSINTEMAVAANFKAYSLAHPLMIFDPQVNGIVLDFLTQPAGKRAD